MLGVGWGAERPGTSIVVVADGPEPLRSDIRLPLTPIRKICVKTGTWSTRAAPANPQWCLERGKQAEANWNAQDVIRE